MLLLSSERRATELLAQLGREPSADPKFGIAPKELAETIVRTLSLPRLQRSDRC